jgi:putative ABC transport system permease protein
MSSNRRSVREWASRMWAALRGRGRRTEHDWEAELRAHLELAAEDARRRSAPGASDDMERAVRLRAGGVPQAIEAMRDQRGFPMMDDLRRDLRQALSALRRNPAFTAIAALTLALGIGANSAIVSVVHAVLLRPLPYHEPEKLVTIDYLLAGEYFVLRERVPSLRDMALYHAGVGFNVSDTSGAERLTGTHVSANLFSTLGVAPALGRTFRADEELPGARAVVISHALWRQRFGADPNVIGREILIDSLPREIIGVMPATFAFPSFDTQLWMPFAFDRAAAGALWGGGQRGYAVARLVPGATAARAQSELRARGPDLRKANTLWVFPDTWGDRREVVSLQDEMVGDVRTRLLVMLGAVGFVLLLACANVANLLLARASARQREIAIRYALGASRGRIIRQLLTESAVLGLVGGGAGFLLAYWGVPLLVGSLPADMPRVEEISVDRWMLAFTLGVSILTGVAFGLVPAIQASGCTVQTSLKAEERGATSPLGRASSLLVIGEVAVAVLLVIVAGLLIRSFTSLLRVDPGFRTERIVTAIVTPPAIRYPTDASARVFYDSLLARVAALPGVQSVEAVSNLPLASRNRSFAFEAEGTPYVPAQGSPMTGSRNVTPGYFRVMQIPLLKGRPLTDADRDKTLAVALVNETFARRYFAGVDPIGRRFKAVWKKDWITVVGVVGDVKHIGLAAAAEPEVYRAFAQEPLRDMTLVIRTVGDPAPLAASLRAAVADVDATVPISSVRTADQVLARSVAAWRFTTFLHGAFALVALTLAAIGIYGVLSYAVSRRSREIGVRMALGARRADVLRMVLGRALLLTATGTITGILAAFAATRLLKTLLFEVSPTDLVTFTVVPLLLAAVACLAAYIPASRATRVDPTIALRLE